MTDGNPFGGFNAHTMAHRLRRAEAMAPNGGDDAKAGARRFRRIFDEMGGDDRARLRRFARHQRLAEEAAGGRVADGDPLDGSRLDAMSEDDLRVEGDRLVIFLRAWQDGHDSGPCGLCARR